MTRERSTLYSVIAQIEREKTPEHYRSLRGFWKHSQFKQQDPPRTFSAEELANFTPTPPKNIHWQEWAARARQEYMAGHDCRSDVAAKPPQRPLETYQPYGYAYYRGVGRFKNKSLVQ